MFDDEWSESYRLDHFINGLLWLLSHPNASSALNSSCITNGSFKTAVQLAIHGCPVLGINYPSIANTEVTGVQLVAFMYDHYIAMAKGGTQLPSITTHLNGTEVQHSQHTPEFLKKLGALSMKGQLQKVGKMKRLHKVKKVADKMKVSPNSFTKELLFKVGNDLVLVLTVGTDKVDITALATLFKVDASECTLAPSDVISTKLGWTQYSLPAFGHGDTISKTVVNFDLFNKDPNETLYTASGVPNYLIQCTAQEFKRVLTAAIPSQKLIICDKITVSQRPCELTFSYSIPYRTQYGEKVYVCGSIPELGCWNTSLAYEMQWTDGDVWTCKLSLNKLAFTNSTFQYKYLVTKEGSSEPLRWESITNRSTLVPSMQSSNYHKNEILVANKWDIL